MNYEELLEFCQTPRQKEVIEALIKHGSQYKASKALCMSKRGVEKQVQRIRGYATALGKGSHFVANNNIPPGLAVKGTSTLYKDGEPVLQWVKTNQSLQDQYEAYIELLRDETSHIHKYYTKIKPPKKTIKNLITNYITTDLHFGALMWHEETGHDYDLSIAKETLLTAFKYLLDSTPPTETCIISDLGDMVEADDETNMTKRSKHLLDTDGRYQKVYRVVRDTFAEIVQMALTKHKKVIVILIKGNHDDMTSFHVQEYLSGYFRKENRVIIDTQLRPRKYYIHGSTLLGFTHGHEMKPSHCGEVMAHECREYFHKTLHRYFNFGHVHKDSSGENVICKWETHKNLPPSNNWAMGMGYINQLGTMKAETFCKDHGKQDTIQFSVSRMSEDALTEYDSKII